MRSPLHRTRRSDASEKHLNFIWRSLADVTYPTYPSNHGPPVTVSDRLGTTMRIPRDQLIRTAALERRRQAYVRCSHYDYRGCCDAGVSCTYIHVVTLDPSLATPRRRFRRTHGEHRANVSTSSVPREPADDQPSGIPQVQSPPWWRHHPYEALDAQARVYTNPPAQSVRSGTEGAPLEEVVDESVSHQRS